MFDKLSISQKKSILAVLFLTVLTLAVYWPVQNYEFINFDDQVYVMDNFRIQHGITWKSVTDAFTSLNTGLWHPLTVLSFLFDYQLFGFNAGGYHWTNIILHLFNAVLLFFLVRNLTGALWRSVFVAALFAVHPINVESVAWIAERKNVLSTFFWILTMLFYVEYVKKRKGSFYGLMLVSFALGLMSKPMLVTLPFVLLLMDYWPLNRTFLNPQIEGIRASALALKKEKPSFLVAEKIPLFVLTMLSVGVTLFTANRLKTLIGLDALPLMSRLGNMFYSYAMYLKKLVWPLDLSVFYPLNNLKTWEIIFGLFIFSLITAAVCKYFRKIPYLGVGWFWYLGTLVPVIGLVQNGPYAMADRFAYIPFIGLFIMISWGLNHLFSNRFLMRKIFIVGGMSLILLFSLIARHQVRIWTDTTTLFEDAIRKNPNNYKAYQIIGLERAREGDNTKAIDYYDRAIKLNPKSSTAYNNRGISLLAMGKKQEAYDNFKKAIEINKFMTDAYHNIGQLYLDEGDWDNAIRYSLKAIENNPEYVKSYNNIGVAFVRKQNPEKALKYFEMALDIHPSYIVAQKNLQIARIALTRKQ
ncbi:MAG: tetratricopeptide repeat protein [Smithella sp.]|nr:tetratricopeptide repeat protein [Smithella sp.]